MNLGQAVIFGVDYGAEEPTIGVAVVVDGRIESWRYLDEVVVSGLREQTFDRETGRWRKLEEIGEPLSALGFEALRTPSHRVLGSGHTPGASGKRASADAGHGPLTGTNRRILRCLKSCKTSWITAKAMSERLIVDPTHVRRGLRTVMEMGLAESNGAGHDATFRVTAIGLVYNTD